MNAATMNKLRRTFERNETDREKLFLRLRNARWRLYEEWKIVRDGMPTHIDRFRAVLGEALETARMFEDGRRVVAWAKIASAIDEAKQVLSQA